MSEEFISILKETGAIGENIRDLFEKIRSHYSQPFRFYHTIDHIKEMLSGLQKIKDKINDFNLIYLAIWFHDVHYDPKASNNEEESADLAAVELQKLKIPSKNIKSICE
ncbi:MAG: hypothetical protein KDK36_18950, partial [Leptospiraceae bacterium]|nr:hypothetical protein [Leptospiraceae bacterium]